jgi:hypothetical protein
MKKNLYLRREVWNAAGKEEKFLLANLGQVPSYVSLTTALDYYEITTQVTRDYFESVAVKRTNEILLNGTVFRYTKITGAFLESDLREYCVRDKFSYLKEKLAQMVLKP